MADRGAHNTNYGVNTVDLMMGTILAIHDFISRLKLVQNAAARFLPGARRREHNTPVLANLYWSLILFRIDLKILLFVFKSLHGLMPAHVMMLLFFSPYFPSRFLWSVDKLLLSIQNVRYKILGQHAFLLCGPSLWKQIPFSLRQFTSLNVFKLFSVAFIAA